MCRVHVSRVIGSLHSAPAPCQIQRQPIDCAERCVHKGGYDKACSTALLGDAALRVLLSYHMVPCLCGV